MQFNRWWYNEFGIVLSIYYGIYFENNQEIYYGVKKFLMYLEAKIFNKNGVIGCVFVTYWYNVKHRILLEIFRENVKLIL